MYSQCHRLDGGLSKLLAASEQLKELNEKLEVQKVAVTEKSEACEKLLEEIQRATELANEKKKMAIGKKEEISEQNKIIKVEKAAAEEALAEALPALEEAKFALQDLNKSDVTEIRLGLETFCTIKKHKLKFTQQQSIIKLWPN